MSSAVPRDSGPDRGSGDGASKHVIQTESTKLGSNRYLDPALVAALEGEIAVARGAGRVQAPQGDTFDRHDLEERIVARSSVAARAALDAARERDVVPPEPMLPPTRFDGERELLVLRTRGYLHYLDGAPCQDGIAVRFHQPSGTHCLVVADGVSAAPLAHHGAAILSRALAQIAEDLVTDPTNGVRTNGSFMTERFLHELYVRTMRAYLDLCERTGHHPREASELYGATTLQLAVVTPTESAMVGLSDGIFRWGGDHTAVAQAVDRRDPGFNTPPLLERVILDEIERQSNSWGNLYLRQDEVDIALIREAECFHVIAYGASSEVVPGVVEMATDGGQYTDMLPARPGNYFPLVRMAVEEGRPFEDIGVAVQLAHLEKIGERIGGYERLARDFFSLRADDSARTVGEAALLERLYDRVGEDRRADTAVALRDFMRTLPRGRDLTFGFSGQTGRAELVWALGRLANEIELESFGAFLEQERRRFEGAALSMVGDLVSEGNSSPCATEFLEEVRSKLLALRGAPRVAAIEIEEGLPGIEEREMVDVVRMIEREPIALLDVRREFIRAAVEQAAPFCRARFGFDPHRLTSPVADDLTWCALGTPTEPTGSA